MKITKLLFLFSLVFLLASCGNDTKKPEETKAPEKTTPKIAGDASNINIAESVILWKGTKKVGDFHQGTITLKSGNIISNPAGVVGGSFVIDMATIADVDKDPDLEGHLKSDDFFSVGQFPVASYEITKVATLINNTKGSHMVYGNLTIKGITKPTSFVANIAKSASGFDISTPTFTIDRTDFNVKYNSSKFFDNLKDKVINDPIELTLKIKV